MARNPFWVCRFPNTFKDLEAKHLAPMREAIVKARELLESLPLPDTFAGRKTQEPFPREDDR